LFENTSNCYKFFWLQAILEKVDSAKCRFTFDELINEIIADARYMVTEYHLRLCPLGVTDNLEEVVKYIHKNYGLISNTKRENIIKFLEDSEDKRIAIKMFKEKQNFSVASVKRFAKENKIAPGIVVGRLQNEGCIEYNMLNELKEHYVITV
jgi:hypothetical protein